MGGILIVLAALGAFAIGGAIVLLISVYRRSEQHRAALLQAYSRIDQLERMMKAITFGELPAPQVLRQVGSAIAEPLPPLSERTQTSQPSPAPEIAEPAPEPAAPVETPQPEPVARAAAPEPAPSEAFADETVAERIAREDHPTKWAPPQPGVIAAATGLIALAALATVRVGAFDVMPGMAIAILAGAGAIAFAEWRRTDAFAPLLTIFGGTLIIAALIVARTTPAGITPVTGLIACGALGIAALTRAQALGRWLITFGLVCIAAAPAFALDGAMPVHARHVVLFAALIAAFAIAIARGQKLWLRLALVIAFAWGAYSAARAISIDEAISTAVFLIVLAALSIAHAWEDARDSARPLGDPRRRASLFIGLSGATLASVLIATLAARHSVFAPIGAAALGVHILGAAAAAAWRQGIAPLPLASCTLAAALLAFWPGAEPSDWIAIVITAAALASAAALGGVIMMARGQDEGAVLVTLAPLAFAIAAQARAEPALEPWMWAAAAGGLAAASLALLAALRGPMRLASEIFAAGAALSMVAAVGFAAPAPWPPLIVALAIPAICAAFAQLRLDGLRYAAAILGVFLLLQLFAPQLAAASAAMRIIIYIFAITALFAGSQILARTDALRETQALLAASLLAIAAALSIEAHRIFQIAAPDFRLLELGAHVILWLGLAFALAFRFSAKPSQLIAAVEGAAFAAAALYALAAGVIVLNPWWGIQPAPATGWTGVNLLLLAYLAPAALFVAYGRLRERQGLKIRAAIALGLGLTLALLYVTLELRRLFHGAIMTGGLPATTQEGWAYTIGWLGFAAALALLALERTAAWVRHAAAFVALAALAKAALFDLGAFDGLVQLAMLGLLVGAAVAIVLLYRRYGLPTSAAAPKTNPQQPQSAGAQPATEPS